MYMPIYFLELELRQICVKHDDFVCKYFLVNVSISYDSGSEMPSGRSARFLQLADLLCVTVALLHIWLNQQEVLHLLSHWACGQSSGQNFQEEARTARGPKRPNFMELGFQYQILGSRMKMNCTFVCLLFLKKLFSGVETSIFMDRKLLQGRAVIICCINKYILCIRNIGTKSALCLNDVSSEKRQCYNCCNFLVLGRILKQL